MIESKAKTKWCPFVRHQSEGIEPAGNRFGVDKNPSICGCIASDCMAWRWVATQDVKGDKKPLKVAGGYCGLGGRE